MEVLKRLCELRGVSGHETNVAAYTKELFSEFADDVFTDKSGNVIAKADNGADFTVLLEAHLDEIGFIVTEIDENGFLRFLPVGGISSDIMLGKEVTVHGKTDIFGVIGAKPPHLMSDEDKKKRPEYKDMFIDIGLPYDEAVQIVSVGDVVSFNASFHKLSGTKIASKSLDNRAGIYVLYKCLEQLRGCKNANIIAVAAVQEELGCLGAKSAVFGLNPDYAMVVDVTHGQSAYVDKYETFKLSEGATVGIGPNFSNAYNKQILNLCADKGIKFQKEVCEGHSGTDAWPIQISNNGIPCSLISIPLKHMHSQTELCDFDDIDSAIDIICTFAKEVHRNA